MESIIARALEYTLKYWLKSFSRDQFKLQGRTAQLSNLDINGEALHSSMGLPPALHVATAKVAKLQIMLPYVSYVQVEPIVIHIDRLDLVLEEKTDLDENISTPTSASSTSAGKSSGYGFADKIADGMTIQVDTVNLLIQTRGGAKHKAGAAWIPPVASITIRNLVLYTTNENWEVVNLKDAREFSSDKKFIYVFKKLEWGSLSIDLLPHPDMFLDADESHFEEGAENRDDDGAKRAFFGGERFIDGISGQAYITLQRSDLNCPLGLEVQIHVTEAVCPALSEPGLRALLRCLTGFYVCLSRGDVDPRSQQDEVDAAGRSIFSIAIDHIFICIKDAEFQLELLMQSLQFCRTSLSDGESAKSLTQIMLSGLILRDTFTRPPCLLVQPTIELSERVQQPFFGLDQDFCPPIYPLGLQPWQLMVIEGIPLIYIRSLQVKPPPEPPMLASESFIDCRPLTVHLQEESLLRIASFLSDGVVIGRGTVLPDFSINSIVLTLRELTVTIPMDLKKNCNVKRVMSEQSIFSGARLQIQNLFFSEMPTLKFRKLKLEKDPACFCLWENQPVDASQKKLTVGASHVTLSLEASTGFSRVGSSLNSSPVLWKCVELKEPCIEVAMATADGSPLTSVPPPGGLVRMGVSVQQYLSNTSVEQLFFTLYLYAHIGNVCEKVATVGQDSRLSTSNSDIHRKQLIEKAPSDADISLTVNDLQLRFLETTSSHIEGNPLVQFVGNGLLIKVHHRTLGGAVMVSSTFQWETVEVSCVDAPTKDGDTNAGAFYGDQYGSRSGASVDPCLKAVFWIQNQGSHQLLDNRKKVPFLDVTVSNVIPLSPEDAEYHSLSIAACIAGIRLGGGMNYTESLLHRFGIFGPDGGPGDKLSRGIDNLSSGPLSKLFKPHSPASRDINKGILDGSLEGEGNTTFQHLGRPDNIDVSIEFKDWLFALQGAQDIAESWWFDNHNQVGREERSWHTTFRSLQVKAKSKLKESHIGNGNTNKKGQPPVESIEVIVEGLQILKPKTWNDVKKVGIVVNGLEETIENPGVDLEAQLVTSVGEYDDEIRKWVVEKIKFSVKRPIEAVMTKNELQYLTALCKSEVDSLGRIAAGVLQILKLEGSVGQAGMDQLGNLSSEGFDKIFNPSEFSNGCHKTDGTVISPSQHSSVNSTISLLDEAIQDSQVKCCALKDNFTNSGSPDQQLDKLDELTKKLENMQGLLKQLHTQL